MSKIKSIGASLLVLVLAIAAAIAAYFGAHYLNTYKKVDEGIKDNQVQAIQGFDDGLDQSTHTPEAPQLNQETILLIGSDDRVEENSDVEGARSDTMIILTMNEDRSNITGVSIPRDLMVQDMPSCQVWDSTTREMTDDTWDPNGFIQANSAYSTGGPGCAVRLAEHISGTQIDRYAEINFEGFKELVDAVGGVKVNICAPMIDKNDGIGTIFEEPGVYQIDGEKALDFARARYVVGDSGSDLSRMDRQQYLIQQIIDQKLNAGTLLDKNAVESLSQAFVNNTKTDNIDMNFLMGSAMSARNLENFDFFTLPTEQWPQDPNRLVDDEETTNWIFSQLRQGNHISEEDVENYQSGNIPSSSASLTPSPEETDTGIRIETQSTKQTVGTQNTLQVQEVSERVAPSETSTIPCGWG